MGGRIAHPRTTVLIVTPGLHTAHSYTSILARPAPSNNTRAPWALREGALWQRQRARARIVALVRGQQAGDPEACGWQHDGGDGVDSVMVPQIHDG